MSNWFSGDVIANGIRIHYYRTGGNKRPLVLSHGATDAALCWIPLTKALEADYDVIMPDARGHGLSEAPENDYSTAARAADLVGLIQALGLEKPALGGHSMGAGTTLRLIADHPDLACCAILEDPALRAAPPTQAEQEARAVKSRADAAERKAKDRTTLIAQGRASNPAWSADELEAWADAKQRVSLNFAGAIRFPDGPDWRELFPKVTCPTLLITADPDRGAIVTPQIAEEARRLLPSLKVARISGAGHSIRREQFDAYLAAVRGFLDGL